MRKSSGLCRTNFFFMVGAQRDAVQNMGLSNLLCMAAINTIHIHNIYYAITH